MSSDLASFATALSVVGLVGSVFYLISSIRVRWKGYSKRESFERVSSQSVKKYGGGELRVVYPFNDILP